MVGVATFTPFSFPCFLVKSYQNPALLVIFISLSTRHVRHVATNRDTSGSARPNKVLDEARTQVVLLAPSRKVTWPLAQALQKRSRRTTTAKSATSCMFGNAEAASKVKHTYYI